MTYLAPGPRRERILLYGPFGTGKSEAVTRIYEKALPEGATLHITDTERAYEALLDIDQPNINFSDLMLEDWPEYVASSMKIARDGKPDDWWAVDSATQSWESIQQYALDEKWESDMGGIDWVRVNREHARLYKAYLSFKGHLMLTARAKDLSKPQKSGKVLETKESVTTYGPIGQKPTGQKDLGHVPPHTVLYTGRRKTGEWVMTTVKDRKRREVENLVVRDFVRDYLVGIAGWKSDDEAVAIDLSGLDLAGVE